MNKHQRQLVLLVGFMTLLAVVMLFLFVYAPNPAEAPSAGMALPDSLGRGLNSSVEGWSALFEDLGSANQGLSG